MRVVLDAHMLLSAALASGSPLRASSTRIKRVDDMARGGAFPLHEAAAHHAHTRAVASEQHLIGVERRRVRRAFRLALRFCLAVSGEYEKRFHGS